MDKNKKQKRKRSEMQELDQKIARIAENFAEIQDDLSNISEGQDETLNKIKDLNQKMEMYKEENEKLKSLIVVSNVVIIVAFVIVMIAVVMLKLQNTKTLEKFEKLNSESVATVDSGSVAAVDSSDKTEIDNFINFAFQVDEESEKVYVDKNNNIFYYDADCTKPIKESPRFASLNGVWGKDSGGRSVKSYLLKNGKLAYIPTNYNESIWTE